MTAPDPIGPQNWEQQGGERRYDGYTIVRRDTYRLPDGSVSDWDVLEQEDTVAVVAFTETGSVLLFDQYRVGPARVLSELPGGMIDAGETPLVAGARELEEETGFRASALFHAGSEWAAANSTRRSHIVVAAGCHRVAAPRWEAGEVGVMDEIAPQDLMTHLLSGDLSDAGAALRGLHTFARADVENAHLQALQVSVRRLLGATGVALPAEDPIDRFWASVDLADADGARDRLESLLRAPALGAARIAYERASLHDSLGEEAEAIPLYREALAAGLDDSLRTQATIQLASSLRNVGDASGAIALLQAVPGDDPLAESARAFLALALFSDEKPAAALGTALQTLAPHLPRYQRAVGAYASELVAPERIRVIAVGLLVREGWVLAEEYEGGDGGGRFLRAPGGGVEFGETAEQTIHREFAEELDATLESAHLLGVTENIFERAGKRGHEIVYTYAIRSAALEALPLAARLAVRDADTTVGWYRLDTLSPDTLPLYPTGILDLPGAI